MTPSRAPSLSWRRAQRSFWGLVSVAVVAAGFLSSAARAHPGPFTAVRVVISGTALALSVTLAGRVFVHLERARRATHQARSDADHEVPEEAPDVMTDHAAATPSEQVDRFFAN